MTALIDIHIETERHR